MVEITVRAPLGCFRSPGGEIVDSSREPLENLEPNVTGCDPQPPPLLP